MSSAQIPGFPPLKMISLQSWNIVWTKNTGGDRCLLSCYQAGFACCDLFQIDNSLYFGHGLKPELKKDGFRYVLTSLVRAGTASRSHSVKHQNVKKPPHPRSLITGVPVGTSFILVEFSDLKLSAVRMVRH